MCGRYVSVRARADLVNEYHAVRADGPELDASYNVAPMSLVYAVLDRADPENPGHVERQLHAVRWGLVPSWAKGPEIGHRLVNARVETLGSKPSWRTAYRKRRAVIPADGYYEWHPVETDGNLVKQPYYLHPVDGGLLSFAGLYEWWPDPAKDEHDPERWLWTAVIITTDARGPAGEIHGRTPLCLPPDRIDAWLDPQRTDPVQVAVVLTGIGPPALQIRPVSREVNRVGSNGAHLIDPLPNAADRPQRLALAS